MRVVVIEVRGFSGWKSTLPDSIERDFFKTAVETGASIWMVDVDTIQEIGS